VQALHRIRAQLIKWRTALANEIRGLLAEYGIVVTGGIAPLRRMLPVILEDAENRLSGLFREMLGEMAQRLRVLDERLRQYDLRVARVFGQDERCHRLAQVEGVGPLIATALVAAVRNAHEFKSGRELSAWLGLVPRQHSSGGKDGFARNQQTRRPVFANTLHPWGTLGGAHRGKTKGSAFASRSVCSRDARDQTWLRSRSRIATCACCGRYSPRVRVIEQRRFPPASPQAVEGRPAENGYYQPEIAPTVFDDDGEPVRPALSKPELRRGLRGHMSDEVESARIPSGPGVSKSHPSKRPGICEQPILSIKRQPCAEAGSIYASTSTDV
jgi:transposase IS116/IS110/IS902 family protein